MSARTAGRGLLPHRIDLPTGSRPQYVNADGYEVSGDALFAYNETPNDEPRDEALEDGEAEAMDQILQDTEPLLNLADRCVHPYIDGIQLAKKPDLKPRLVIFTTSDSSTSPATSTAAYLLSPSGTVLRQAAAQATSAGSFHLSYTSDTRAAFTRRGVSCAGSNHSSSRT
jgi:hypothetical protein